MIPQEADQTHIEYGFPVELPATVFIQVTIRHQFIPRDSTHYRALSTKFVSDLKDILTTVRSQAPGNSFLDLT